MIEKILFHIIALSISFSTLCYAGNNNYANKKASRGGLLKTSYSETHHLFGGYVDGSYTLMNHNNDNLNFKPQGHSESLGIVYEFQHTIFCLQTGFGLRFQQLHSPYQDYSTISIQQDAWGYAYTLNHQFTNRQDYASTLYLQVPIMLGIAYNGFYSLAGIKLNQPIAGSTRITTICNTWGEYSQYIGTFEEHDNHGFRKDVEINQKNPKLSLRTDILASLEIGYDYNSYIFSSAINSNTNYRIRIAAFIDYGLLNINTNTNLPICNIPLGYMYDIPTYQLNHIYNSTQVSNNQLHNIFAGIKLTFLIGFRNKERCVTCNIATRYF